MNRWKCQIDAEGTALLEAVAREMVAIVGISEAEAVARINSIWGHLSLQTEEEKLVHQNTEPDRWALMIYYGRTQQRERAIWNRREFVACDRSEFHPATLSFTAQPVLQWVVDLTQRRLSVSVGRTVDADPIRQPFEIRVGPFAAMRGWRKPLGEPPQAIADPSEPLTEVNEFGFGPPVTWLKGFGGVTGHWLHYEFEGPALVVYE
jgi:hypothetical protein